MTGTSAQQCPRSLVIGLHGPASRSQKGAGLEQGRPEGGVVRPHDLYFFFRTVRYRFLHPQHRPVQA